MLSQLQKYILFRWYDMFFKSTIIDIISSLCIIKYLVYLNIQFLALKKYLQVVP